MRIGTITLQLKKKGFKVTGVYFSEIAIRKSQSLGIDAFHSDIDKEGLLFFDNFFDLAWADDVIEHVFEQIFLFDEMFRVLKDIAILL